MSADRPKLVLGQVVRDAVRVCRTQWRLLLAVGLIVFVPVGLLEALDGRAHQAKIDELSDLAAIGVAALAIGHAASELLGEVFYSGVAAAGVGQARRGERRGLAAIARLIPFWRLLVVDLLFAAVVLLGFVLLIVPGIVLFVWLSLAGPVVEIERRPPLAALRRSRELVRGYFWRVLWIVVPLELGTDALFTAAGNVSTLVLGDSLIADWVGSTLGGLVATLPYAATIVVLTYELIALEREKGQP